MTQKRQKIIIEGIVQGVGFRPFIHQLAMRYHMVGSVRNDSRGVTVEVQGEESAVDEFVNSIHTDKPPLAVIDAIDIIPIPLRDEVSFAILQSSRSQLRRAQIPPDTCVCDDCLRELFDPTDRRYLYPFINCTNCGPRYSIVTGIPYDRPLTTMRTFSLCAACRDEYQNPESRRFHAQPNACPDCGPHLQLVNAKGKVVDALDPITEAIHRLDQGQIVAVKGLGGYHLAVDPKNQKAVEELRYRKKRDEKPFALMAKDIETVNRFAVAGDDEIRLMQSAERPIVLVRKRNDHELAENIAPGNRFFGILLPYTPLHYLLLAGKFSALVMTSANLSDDPIAYQDAEALIRLGAIADVFLNHDREIYMRTDDSIARIVAQRPVLLRRSRGFVPRSIGLPESCQEALAVGGELKNTICLTRGGRAFLSQHIGDLKNLEVYDSFKKTISHLMSILEITPKLVAHDLHPDYYSSRFASEQAELEKVGVQHHHAHFASCLAENGGGSAIGVIFDGAGYGLDNKIWGGEFLVGDYQEFQRHGHIQYQPMPGGDLATKEPWRMALSYLMSLYGESIEDLRIFPNISDLEWQLVSQAIQKKINSPLTSSCGRLFDAVAAILGLREKVSFEGQAAMELEMIADPGQSLVYPVHITPQNGQLIIDVKPLIESVLKDHLNGIGAAVISGRFHASLANIVEEVCSDLRRKNGLNRVVLSGGVFQNCLLTEMSKSRLESSGFKVLTHSQVPPNDGGLALGQAVVAISKGHS